MRLLRALFVIAAVNAPAFLAAAPAAQPPAAHPSGSGAAAAHPAAGASSITVLGAPGWTSDGQPQGGAELGFAPLSVTQSGVAYSTGAMPQVDPTTDENDKIADLPAWASSYFGEGRKGREAWLEALGYRGLGNMSGPAAWAAVMVGVALIGGALRGLIVANRRLNRLRSEDDLQD